MKTATKPTTETPPPSPPPTPAPAAADSQPAVPLPLMPRHRAVFEQAREHIEKMLGKSPAPDELMRLWLATATPWDVTRIFEDAVLHLAGSDLMPVPGEDYNQTVLAL